VTTFVDVVEEKTTLHEARKVEQIGKPLQRPGPYNGS
jgi:hypothetical protein